MQLSNRVIQLAKERALFGFSVLVQSMLRDADEGLMLMMGKARSGAEQFAMNTGHHFIKTAGPVFLQRVESQYRELLERAMETMYANYRSDLREISVETLTLIDDETVTRQIEVDRLVARLRDANEDHLRKLNLIIAQLHEEREVRERENPFRPYLIARTVHQKLHEMIAEEDVARLVFDALSDPLVNRIDEFYGSIRQVFESNGIHASLMTRKSPATPVRNDVDAGQMDIMDAEVSARMMPAFERMLSLMGDAAPEAGRGRQGGAARAHQQFGFQQYVSDIFNPDSDGLPELNENFDVETVQGMLPFENSVQPGSRPLIMRMNQFQAQAAMGKGINEQLSIQQNQLFALHAHIGADQATKLERVAIEVVAMLFELILGDEQIAEHYRTLISPLQIPFLKAAILDPAILRQGTHPARQLINRMGSSVVGLDPTSPLGRSFGQEIARVVQRILAEFEEDVEIFADCLAEIESFLADKLRHTDAVTEQGVEVLERIEDDVAQNHAKSAPPAWLADLDIDPRVVSFIVNCWMRVLECEVAMVGGEGASRVYRDLLPDLIWSVQEKQTPAERSALIQLLPTIVRRLKAGLASIQLPEAEARNALDQLVAVHTDVLRGTPMPGNGHAVLTLKELRTYLSDLEIGQANPPLQSMEYGRLREEFSKRGLSIALDLEREETPSYESDADWLIRLQIGTCVERWSELGYQLARVVWISDHRSLYMLHLEEKSVPVVYSAVALIKSLREGSVRMIEHAPIFERSVESLVKGARAVDMKRKPNS